MKFNTSRKSNNNVNKILLYTSEWYVVVVDAFNVYNTTSGLLLIFYITSRSATDKTVTWVV